MPKKKSGKKAAGDFITYVSKLEEYIDEIDAMNLTAQTRTWAYEAAVIKLAVGFERLVLTFLIVAINNDTSTLSQQSGITFPKHLTDEVCGYLITGGSHFDFRGGRDGLIRLTKRYLPDDHWFIEELKKRKWRKAIDGLVSLRNFAAHESPQAKKIAKEATRNPKLGSAGVYLKQGEHFLQLAKELKGFAEALRQQARY